MKPILGIEAYLTDDVDNIMTNRPVLDSAGRPKVDKKTGEPLFEKQRPRDFNHGCMWAEDDEGLENLLTLSTLSYERGFYRKPRIDLRMMREHSHGLFVSDGCLLSQVARAAVAAMEAKDDRERQRAIDGAYDWIQSLVDIFGKDHVLIELHTWQFTDPKDDEHSLELNRQMRAANHLKLQLANDLGLMTIAVNDAHYGPREDYMWHELEWSTTTKKGEDYNDDKTDGRGETAAWVMNDDEVRYWLGRHGLPSDAIEESIENTSRIADACHATINRRLNPPRFLDTREEDERLFTETVREGFSELVPRKRASEYMDRLNREVELIVKCDLTGYFNTVADYANFVRAEDPDGERYGIEGKHASLVGPARGSAGGSLVCYLMHITNMDPIRFDLIFERFLTAGRVISTVHVAYEDGTEKAYDPSDMVTLSDGTQEESWHLLDEKGLETEDGVVDRTWFDFHDCPDIDLDFTAEVIPYLNAYLRRRYGEYNFCHIGTFQELKLASAIKDIARVDGITPQEAMRYVRALEAAGWPMNDSTLSHTFDELWDCIRSSQELMELDRGFWERVWQWCGRFRSEGIHASGYIISKPSLMGRVPLRRKTGEDMFTTQWDYDSIVRCGFIKFDILKLASLDTITDVYRLTHRGEMDVREIYREMRDERLLEGEDLWRPTWDGDTLGIFQMDTKLGTTTAMNARIMSLRDAGMLSAADRPGLVRSGLIDEFYKVRLGQDEPNRYHPLIDDILEETDGFILYQEQIMGIYQRMCGMTMGEADNVRKIFSKKKLDKVEEMRGVLHDSCLSNAEFVRLTPKKYKDAEECFSDIWRGLSRTAEYSFNKAHCLSGMTNVMLGTGEVISMSELYKRFSNGERVTLMQMKEDGTIAPGLVADVMDSGVKEVLTITLENGTKIRATPEHRFLTTRGYVQVKDFVDGEELIFDGSRSYARTALSESMKRTQSKITYEQRSRHQKMVQMMHPDRLDNSHKAAQESLRKLRRDPEWMKRFSVNMSKAQTKYWSAMTPDQRKTARNWSGWTYTRNMSESERVAWRIATSGRTKRWFRSMTDDEREEWQRKVIVGKRRNGCVGFGRHVMLPDGRVCDSEFEADVALYLMTRKVDFELHKRLASSTTGNFVWCDFYVDGLYIEADGLGRGREHFRRRKYGDDIPFVVVTPNDYKFVIDAMLMSSHIRNGIKVRSVAREQLPGRWHKTYCRTYDVTMDDTCPANFIANGIVSHNSQAYGMITSIEELYKVNFPAEFITASLNTDPADVRFISYARAHGIRISPPNVNASGSRYELRDGVIYMPLHAIKGIGAAAMKEIRDGAPYSSFEDYLERTSGRGGRKKDTMTSLISIGAFDGVDPRDRFELMVLWKTMRKEEPPKRNTWKSPRIRGRIEERLIGVSLSYDPVFDNRELLESLGPQTMGDMLAIEVGRTVEVAGEILEIRRHQAKSGEMAWIKVRLVSHEEVDVTSFPRTWAGQKDLIQNHDLVSFRCKRDDDYNGRLSLISMRCRNLSIELEGKED